MTEYAIPAEADQQANHALTLVDRAIAIVISTDTEYGTSGQLLQEVRAKYSELDRLEKSITKPINDGLRKIRDFFRVPKSRLESASESLERVRSDYRTKVDAERREAERIAQEAARKERERLEREAAAHEERERKKREAEEAAAKALEDAGKSERAEAARLASAEKARISAARAAALRDIKESFPTAPIVHREPPKTQGVYTVVRWSAKVIDKAALISAVAAGQAPDSVLTVNLVALNQMAVALKDQLHYPGVQAVKTETESVRAQ